MHDPYVSHLNVKGNFPRAFFTGKGSGCQNEGNTPRKKDEVKRLQLRIRTFKGSLTTEIKKFVSFIEHYEKKYPQDDEVDLIGTTKINYANGILKSFDRVTEWYIQLENALDELRILMSDTWEGTEDQLDAAISKHNEGFQKYEKDYVEMTRKNDKTIERCKDILIKSSRAQSISEAAPSTNENRVTGTRPQPGFRPQADLKPAILTKDCDLIEFTEFTKAYIIYMNSS